MSTALGNLAGALIRAADELDRRWHGCGWDKLAMNRHLGAVTNCAAILASDLGPQDLERLPEDFVLKNSVGWSCNRVYCLTQREGRYYEALRRRWLEAADLTSILLSRPGPGRWFAHEYWGAAPTLPFEYKVYTAGDSPAFVMEVHRSGIYGVNLLDARRRTVAWEAFTPGFELPAIPSEFMRFAASSDQWAEVMASAADVASRLGVALLRLDYLVHERGVVLSEVTPVCGILYEHDVSAEVKRLLAPNDCTAWLEKRARWIRRLAAESGALTSRLAYESFLAELGFIEAEASWAESAPAPSRSANLDD